MPQLHERVGSQLVDSFLPKRERMRTPALPMSIVPENPRWQPGPEWNPEGSCAKGPPRLWQLPAPQKPQELCRRPHSEVRRSTGPKLHVHKRLTAPNKGQVRHTRKFPRKDPTGDLGSRIWLGGIFMWSSKLVRTRNREILMWALNMPCFTAEAQCRAKISPGKQLVTKSELTEPWALV